MAKCKYDRIITPDVLLLLKGWARDGLNDKELCERLHIQPRTFYSYQKKFPEFAEAITEGRKPVIVEVEDTFFKKKLQGYKVTEVTKEKTVQKDAAGIIVGTTEHVRENERYIPPDTGAIIFFLKCRARDKYNEVPNSALTEKKLKAEIALLEKKIEALDGSDNTTLEILDKILDGIMANAKSKAKEAETDETTGETEESENV